MNSTFLRVGTGISFLSDPKSAAKEAVRLAKSGLDGKKASLGMVFFSPRHASEEVFDLLQDELKDIPIIGSSTAGEILNGPHQKSIVVVLLSSEYIEAKVSQVAIGDDLNRALDQLLEEEPIRLVADQGFLDMVQREGRQIFGILFSPGNTKTRDSPGFRVFQHLKEALGEQIPIVGACSADDWEMKENFTLGPNGIEANSIAFGLIVTSLRFGIGMDHGFVPTDRHALVTRSKNNTILELNGLPALEVAEWLFETNLEDLEGGHIGLKTKRVLGIQDRFGKYFVVVPSFLTPEGGIRTSQPVYPGTRLVTMIPGPRMPFTAQEAISKALLRAGSSSPAFTLLFSCALIWKMVGEEKKAMEIDKIRESFGLFPVAGFYSFGEEGIPLEDINRHSNAAVSCLVLCDRLNYGAEIYLENKRLIETIERQKKELQIASEEWELTFNALPISIAVLDKEFGILKLNTTMAEALGASKEELIGKKCYSLVHGTDLPPTNCPYKEMLSDGRPRLKEMYEPNLGGWNLVGVAPIGNTGGRIERAIHFAINIQDKKLLEQSQERIKKLELSATLAGGIAHDFNNLLTVVLGAIELASLESPKDSRTYRHLLNAKKTIDHMAQLIKRLLLASSFLNLNLVSTELLDLLECSAKTKTKNTEVKLSYFVENIIPKIKLDPFLMSKVFENIIENAVESMEGKGQINIRFKIRSVKENEIPNLTAGEYVEISIQDTGKGIRPEELPKIFDPYYSTKQRMYQKGMGLGLAEALTIVLSHKGTILVESQPNRGTTVSVFLPLIR